MTQGAPPRHRGGDGAGSRQVRGRQRGTAGRHGTAEAGGGPRVTAPLDLAAIRARLPQRGPALLIDAVLDHGPGFALALRDVGPDDPLIAARAFGGVMLAEAMAQACAFAHPAGGPDRPGLLAGLSLWVKAEARAGDRLLLHAVLRRHRAGLARFDTRAEAGGRLLARAQITLAAG